MSVITEEKENGKVVPVEDLEYKIEIATQTLERNPKILSQNPYATNVLLT